MIPKKILALALAAVLVAPLLARAEEVVYQLRSQEDESVYPDCPAGDNVRLGALLYAPRTRESDGLVMKDVVQPIGTAVGCGKLLTFTPFDPAVQSPFAMRFELPGRTFTASGTCTITSLSFPVPGLPIPLLLVGCTLNVNPDPTQRIVRGTAVSTSVFLPGPIPGYGTGSFWTTHLYLAD